jgi:SAM-dependent methyltransferase
VDSAQWDRRYAESELLWGGEPNAFVAAEVADLGPGRALDLAAGEGRNAIWLAQRGWTVTAVDFSAVAMDKAAALATRVNAPTDRLQWICGDVTTYEPESGAYDLVLMAYLHLPADERTTVLNKAAAALAPGGTLLVIAHDLANLTEGVGGPQDATVLFRPQDVLSDLAEAKLDVIRAATVERPVEVEGDPRLALDVLVRLVRPARA